MSTEDLPMVPLDELPPSLREAVQQLAGQYVGGPGTIACAVADCDWRVDVPEVQIWAEPLDEHHCVLLTRGVTLEEASNAMDEHLHSHEADEL